MCLSVVVCVCAYMCVGIVVCVCMGVHMQVWLWWCCACVCVRVYMEIRGQLLRIVCFSSTIWVLQIESSSLGLATSAVDTETRVLILKVIRHR